MTKQFNLADFKARQSLSYLIASFEATFKEGPSSNQFIAIAAK